MEKTIFALATPLGNGIAVMRISGSRSLELLHECFSHDGEYEANKMYYGYFIDKFNSNKVIDECFAVYFAGPKSFTGEDSCEIQFHGSIAVANAIMDVLSDFGLSLAMPGEFTRRAFENGRIDLSQAEAVMDLISSSACSSSDAALDQLSGKLGDDILKLQNTLTDAIASIEAQIDYPDEEWDQAVFANAGIEEVRAEIEKLVSSSLRGMILRDGYKVALLGLPNAGKSTLLNTLLGYNRAIVSEFPGTTRDLIEESLSIGGIPIRLVDTAGIRHSDEIVEKIGIDLAMQSAEKADLILLVLDSNTNLSSEEKELIDFSSGKNTIILLNKSDLIENIAIFEDIKKNDCPVISISAKHGKGIELLEEEILKSLEKVSPFDNQVSLITNQRHLEALKSALLHIKSAIEASTLFDLDCVCIDLRAAWSSLGEISGVTVNEEIIDRIFSKFCLGK